MNEKQVLGKMIPPGKRRSRKVHGGVIQIWVTRACDKACFGCTQGSNLKGKYDPITPEQFELACVSLKGYFGTVGVFGGNPPAHPQFDKLCEILREHIPYEHRGLWASNLNGRGAVARKTFNPGASNLNVHLDKEAYEEFHRDWPEARPFGLNQDSRHGPPFVAIQDMISNKEERWDLIADCDINRHWSAMICVFRGELRGYFCEIAGAQAMLHQHEDDYLDLGIAIEPDWWKKPMTVFAAQAHFHCHACGVPLRGYGELAQATKGKEQTSETHRAVFNPKVVGRCVEIVTSREQVREQALPKFIDYLGNAKR